jgi:hypothetical protein
VRQFDTVVESIRDLTHDIKEVRLRLKDGGPLSAKQASSFNSSSRLTVNRTKRSTGLIRWPPRPATAPTSNWKSGWYPTGSAPPMSTNSSKRAMQ